MACTEIFDIATVGYTYWWIVVVGAILFTLLVLWGWAHSEQKPAGRIAGFIAPAIVAVVVPMIIVPSHRKYVELVDRVAAGKVNSIEGVVHNFQPANASQEFEEFSIGGRSFRYSDAWLMPGFHQSARYGGPVAPGKYLRIQYVGNDITRLEVCAANH